MFDPNCSYYSLKLPLIYDEDVSVNSNENNGEGGEEDTGGLTASNKLTRYLLQ